MLSAEALAAEDILVHVLWINAGLSCEGDSVALTGATQPSIEEIALGALPGLPKVAVHRLRMRPQGRRRRLHRVVLESRPRRARPVRARRRGVDPQRGAGRRGVLVGFGNNPMTGQPVTTIEWLDRLAPKALAILAAGVMVSDRLSP